MGDFKLFVILTGGLSMLAQTNSQAPNNQALTKNEERSLNLASLKLFDLTYKSLKTENLVVAPVGVLSLIALYGTGADNPYVKQEIVQSLLEPDAAALSSTYSKMASLYSSARSGALIMATKVYTALALGINKQFLSTAVNDFNSAVDRVNFFNPTSAAATINKWAAQKTNGEITDAVSPNDLTYSTNLALVNAIYFKDQWDVPFNPQATTEKPFYPDVGPITTKMTMQDTKYSLYLKTPTAEFVELQYKSAGYRMVIGLPAPSYKLDNLLDEVRRDVDILTMKQSRGAVYNQVKIYLPKFEIWGKLDFNNQLKSGMGLDSMFSVPVGGIVDGEVKVDKVFQRAFIKLDEYGTTAAAFTTMIGAGASGTPPVPFYANRPFLFALLHFDKILFLGTVVK